jgi:tRNA nucleotidyltransferase (CCA-adding enzyme)
MDFDSLAAAFAVTKVHPAAKIALGYPLYGNVKRFVALYRSSLPVVQIKYVDLTKVSRIYVVDCQHADRLDENARKLISGRFGKVDVVIYDHHEPDPGGLAPLAHPDSVIDLVGSTTTILVDKLEKSAVTLTPFEATLLATGIYEDTGSLIYGGTRAKDALAVAYLLKSGADLHIVAENIRPKLTDELAELFEKLLDNARRLDVHGCRVVISHAREGKYIDGLATLTRKLLEVESADVAFSAVYMKDRIHIVARSDSNAFDVRKVVRDFGGDGHPGAASAVAKNADLDWVLDRIEELVWLNARPELTAKQLMTTPVRTVKPNISMDEASRIMLRYGLDGLIVADHDRIEGVISRRDIDQATHHKLGHAPVLGFMSKPVIAITPETPLSRIQEIIIKEDIGRLPVLDQSGKLLGLVSRHDVLEKLYGGHKAPAKVPVWASSQTGPGWEQIPSLRTARATVNLSSKMHALDEESLWLCREIGKAAAEVNMVAYAVGGFVRDLLLDKPNFDLDFVIEGSAIEVGKKLAGKNPGRFEVISDHGRFQTAHLYFHGEKRRDVDLSTARIEFYEYPAALPTVEPSKLEQDLLRRDFTINALAVCCNPDRYGELVDLFGGMQDLESRTIRILHAFSFIEDPTRLVRAARFAARLGFHIGERTFEQAQRAVSMGIFDDLGGVRMKDELKMILESDSRLIALDLLAQIGARLCYLDAHLEYTSRVRKCIRWAERLLHRYKVHEEWVVYLGMLLSGLESNRVPAVLDRLHLSNAQKDIIVKGLEIPSRYPELFCAIDRSQYETPKRSEIFSVLSGKPDESLAIAASMAVPGASIRRLIKTYLGELESTRLEVSGNDLIQLGVKQGPRIGEILRKLFDAKLDGEVTTKESELELAKKLSVEREAPISEYLRGHEQTPEDRAEAKAIKSPQVRTIGEEAF